MSHSYEAVLEQVLPLLHPQDILSCSSTCKRINKYIIRSASIQLILRRYLYQIPPEDSEIHGSNTQNRSSRDELDDLISAQFHVSHLRAKKFTFDLPPDNFILGAAQGYIVTCTISPTRADQGKWELCRIWLKDGTFKTLQSAIHNWITGAFLGDIHNSLINCRQFNVCWAGTNLLLGHGLSADHGCFLLLYEIKKLDPSMPLKPTVVVGLPRIHPKPLPSYFYSALQARGYNLDNSLRDISYDLCEGSLQDTGNVIVKHWSHVRGRLDPYSHIAIPVQRIERMLVNFETPSPADITSSNVHDPRTENHRILEPNEWFNQTFMYIPPTNYESRSAHGSKVMLAEFSSDDTLKVVLCDFNPRLARCLKSEQPLGGCLVNALEGQQELYINKDHAPIYMFQCQHVDPTQDRIEHVRSEGHFETTVVADTVEEFFDGTRLITVSRDDKNNTVDIFDFSGQ